MYINFWYPIARSEDVTTETPFRADLLGMRFVAFRDHLDRAFVLSDVCVHRGGSLGKGWVRDDTVVCPYHGWRFGGDGHCKHIPTLPDETPPARAKIDSYPVQEKYGIVFAFLGDLPAEERPPLCEIPEWGQPGWRANKLTVFEVPAYYQRSMENGLDPSHNEFVHPAQGSPNMNANLRKKPLAVEEIPWGSQFLLRFDNPEEAMADKALGEASTLVSEVTAGSGHVGPNQMMTWIRFSESNMFHQYFFEAPVNERKTRIFFVNMRSFMLDPQHDDRITRVNLVIAQEDIDILAELEPARTPETTTKEVLVPSDRAVVVYRDWLKRFDRKGWRIDMEALAGSRVGAAFAIPGPARRTSRNWVLDPVPLCPAETATAGAAAAESTATPA